MYVFFTRGQYCYLVLWSSEYSVRPLDTFTHTSSMFLCEEQWDIFQNHIFKCQTNCIKYEHIAHFFQPYWTWNCSKNQNNNFWLLSFTHLHPPSPFAESKEEHISASCVLPFNKETLVIPDLPYGFTECICGLRVVSGKLQTITHFPCFSQGGP